MVCMIIIVSILCIFSLYIGWNHLLQQERLNIYRLITPETGPVVGSSLVIKPDYSWAVSYRNDVVSIEHCSMLQKIPSLIDTGKETLGV